MTTDHKKKIVVLAHGDGEIEILVPLLKRIAATVDLIVDAPREKEGLLIAEIGRARSLCGGVHPTAAAERRVHLAKWVLDQSPDLVLTGVHAGDQRRVAEAVKGKVRCAGLVEMTLPSARHAIDKPGSRDDKVLNLVSHALVPTPMREDFQRRFPAVPVVYGVPEPWNPWIERQEKGWRWRLAQSALGDALAGYVVFLGQHHHGNGPVLHEVAEALGERSPIAFVPHPKDDPSKRGWRMPKSCVEIPRDDYDTKLHVLRKTPLVITEYSNMGYSAALVGTPVRYVFADPPNTPDARTLRHLAVALGEPNGPFPVSHVRPAELTTNVERKNVDSAELVLDQGPLLALLDG